MEEIGVDAELPVMRKSRLKTGIKDLDIIMEGGYKNPGNLLFVGPSGMEKAAFAFHFADAADEDENVYIISSDSSPNEIMKKAETIGVSLKKENIRFIDCYTAMLGGDKKLEQTDRIKFVQGASALNDLSLALNEAMKESTGKKMRIIFHTLSTFVLYNPQDSIRKFLNVVEGRFKTAGATAMYLVDEGVHDRQLMGILEQGIDEQYVITEKSGEYFLALPKIPVHVPFKLGPSGINII
jgi:KaiC/GvpD/RAD55 family RecA-like ATPase